MDVGTITGVRESYTALPLMTDLLCIPFKQTLRVDLKKQLSDIIDSTTYQSSSFFNDDLTKVSTLREKVCDSDVSENKLQELKQYWASVTELQEKFPDNLIKFTWFQTLSQKSCECSQHSLKFEKLNVLYNIGSMYSLLAIDSNDGTPVALKKLCLYFQWSAGCFQYILEHLLDTKEPVFDKNTGFTLVGLMLAQAQECFWFKAVQDSHKDSLISRLAQQTADYYEEALMASKKSELVRGDWSEHLKSKWEHFKAVALYRNALALGQSGKFGAMVRSLRMALEYTKKSNLSSKANFTETVQEALKNAERDNDFIYLQPIPSNITPIKPAQMVKALPISEFLGDSLDGENHLFGALLPIEVIEACTAYNERQDAYIKERIEQPLEALNKLLNESLPKYENPPMLKPVPNEEMEQYNLTLADQETNNKTVKALLEEVRGVLSKESETNDYLSARYGEINWNLERSSQLNKGFYEKLAKLENYAKQGSDIDLETMALFQSIDRRLITSDIKLPESNNPVVREAAEAVRARLDYIKKVESKSCDHRFLPRIISNYRSTGDKNFESLFREHLKSFDADLGYVQEQKVLNNQLIDKLQQQEQTPERKRLEPFQLYIEDLRYSLQLLEDVKRNIEEGAKFYQELMKACSSLLSEVQKFEASRREEKRKLEENLRFNVSGLDSSCPT